MSTCFFAFAIDSGDMQSAVYPDKFLRTPLFNQRSRSEDRSSCEFEQKYYMSFSFSDSLNFIKTQVPMPNTGYLVRSLIFVLSSPTEIIVWRILWKINFMAGPKNLLHLVNSQGHYQYARRGIRFFK